MTEARVVYRAAAGIGIALLSCSLLCTEIVLTRIYSVVVWYHFAFFAISVALFGIGAAAVVVHLVQDRIPHSRTNRWLSWCASLLCGVIVAVDLVLVNIPPNWFTPGSAFTELTVRLGTVFALTAAPFFVGGLALSLAMARFVRAVHRLYFWDLFGASAACLLVVPLLTALGGPRALVAASLLAAAAAVAFSDPGAAGVVQRRLTAGVSVVAAAVGLVSAWTGWLDVRVAKGIDLSQATAEYTAWNSFSMVNVFPDVGFRGWGMSPEYRGNIPPQKTLFIDMNAMTTLTRFDGELKNMGHALFDLSALVYAVKRPPGRVCVIGAGGGKDVIAALAGGADHVDAVEINPLIVDDVMRRRYREFTGGLYFRDDVDLHVEDGRSFVESTDERFDVILLSMVDTSAATAAGAYALTENSLYTVDAFEDFFGRLSRPGVLSVSTVSLEGLALGARLVAMARAALERGGNDVESSIMVVQTTWVHAGAVLHDVLVKPSGFSDEEVERAQRTIAALGFIPVYLPGKSTPSLNTEQEWIVENIMTSKEELPVLYEARPLDTSPVGDDRPFFFYQNRLGDFESALTGENQPHLFGNGLAILSKVVLIAAILTVLVFVVPLVLRRKELDAGASKLGWDLGYVSCLGLGFMFIEIAALQRLSLFLGHPTYSLAVVLFILLLSGAFGSRAFASVHARRVAVALSAALGGIVVYTVLFALLGDELLGAAVAASPVVRAVVAALVLIPLGALLGMPFPTGLRAAGARAPRRVPWLWATNSATSVLGSVLATLTSFHAGITATLMAGAGLYALALGLGFVVVGNPPPKAETSAVAA